MSERTKKILFAIFFVIFTLGMGYLLYFMSTRSIQGPVEEGTAPTEPGDIGSAGALPQAGTGSGQTSSGGGNTGGAIPTGGALGINTDGVAAEESAPGEVGTSLLRDGLTQSVSSAPNSDRGVRFYNPEDGRFYRLNADGTSIPLAQKQFFNVQNVEWGHRSDQTVIEFPDGSNVYYDFSQQKQVPLPTHWQDFAFSDNDTSIVAKSVGTNPENRFLIVANPDGSEAKAVGELGDNQDLVHSVWTSSGQIVAYAQTGEPQSDGREEIYMVGQNKENYKSIVVDGQGFLPNWSPTGQNVLYSVSNIASSDRPVLWIASGQAATIGDNRRRVNLFTWADKCVWATDFTLYCAVPLNLPDYAALDRASFADLPDEVYAINLRTGVSTKVSTPEQTRPMRNIVLSGDKSKFIFTDSSTGKLYSYDLPSP